MLFDGDADTAETSGFPLTRAQSRMWFLSRIQPNNPAYTVAYGLLFQEELDADALARSIRVVVSEQDALRTSFTSVEGRPRAVITAPEDVAPDIRWASVPRGPSMPDLIQARLDAAGDAAFDLDSPVPPVWFELVRTSEVAGISALIVCQHHIITDGWSIGVLSDHLASVYSTPSGVRRPLQPSATYRHFAASEAERPSWHEADISYWTERLRDAPALNLPFAGPRPSQQRFRGSSLRLDLPRSISERLTDRARSQRTTPYIVDFTLVAAFLSRLSGQDDFVIGSPHANRDDPDSENTLGLFVNSFGVRTGIKADESFDVMLRRTHDEILEGLDHVGTPFELVVEALGHDRSLSHNPIFQVMVAYQSVMRPPPAFDGVRSSYLQPRTNSARFDLEWTFFPPQAGGGFRLTWNADLFSASDIARLARLFSDFAGRVTSDPRCPVSRIALLDPSEANGLVRRSSVDLTGAEEPIHGLFEAQVEQTPGRIALSSRDASYTYTELNAAADRLSTTLRGAGLTSGDVVATLLPRSPTLVAAILAAFKAGIVILTLDPDQPQKRWGYMIADSGARLVLADGSVDLVDGATWTCDRLLVRENEVFHPAPITVDVMAHRAPTTVAYIIYTSGTTGSPKGVRVPHRSVANTLLATQLDFGFRSDDVFAVLAPVGFDIFFFELFSPLLAGGEARLVSRDEWLHEASLRDVIRRSTCLQAVPGMMRTIVSALGEEAACPMMREVTTGGDRVPPALLDVLATTFPNARVTVTYGPTETAILASRFVRTAPVEGHPIGVPLANVSIKVVDRHGEVVPDGIDGEIYIGGRGVAEGYNGNPGETSRKFIVTGADRFYATGDWGHWTPGGWLEFLGRRDDQFKIRGFRIEAGEIEATILGCPGVAQAVVSSTPDGTGDASLSAFVVMGPDQPGPLPPDTSVQEWEKLFNFVHEGSEDLFSGWHDSYDRRPLSVEAMTAWLRATCDLVRSVLAGRDRGSGAPSILEIGCGTGLILDEIAPLCATYDATDLSPVLVEQVRARASRAGLSQVRIICSAADAVVFHHRRYDLAILNSVSQYFPSGDYLAEVIGLMLDRSKADGSVVLGDVRALHLIPRLYRSIASERAGPEGERVRGEVARLAASEHELLVHPAFIVAVVGRLRPGAYVHVSPKLAGEANEVTCFRFDATIDLEPGPPVIPVWQPVGDGPTAFEAVLDRLDRGTVAVGWRSVKNSWFSSVEDDAASSPERIVERARSYGLSARCSWLSADPEGAFDVVFSKRGSQVRHIAWPASLDPKARLVNTPVTRGQAFRFENHVRNYLRRRLPSYMVPQSIDILDSIPLTPHGKVDRRALPSSSRGSTGMFEAPQGPIEQSVADVWTQVLTLGNTPSRNDNFFRLGGTSLSVIEVAAMLRRRGLNLKPQSLFTYQTVAELGAMLVEAQVVEKRDDRARPAPPPTPSGPCAELPVKPLEQSGEILLTGASGFLGIHLLVALLRCCSATISCPLRAKDAASATSRLRGALEWYCGDLDPDIMDAFDARVTVFPADLANGADTWAAYPPLRPADHIFNAAADVRHVAPTDEVKRANVEGVRAVIALAETWGAVLHHVSSVGVAGEWRRSAPAPRLRECDLDVGQSLTESYSESKLEAEREVRAFQARGGAANLYRASTIAPHSVSGRFQRNIGSHFLSRYLKASIDLGFALDRPDPSLSLVPVDLMAEWVIRLAGDPVAGRTFHLVSPHLLSYTDVIGMAKAAGYPIVTLQQDAFKEAVGREDASDAAVGTLLKQLDVGAARPVTLDASWTWSVFDALKIETFEPTQTWFDRFASHAREAGYFPPADDRGEQATR